MKNDGNFLCQNCGKRHQPMDETKVPECPVCKSGNIVYSPVENQIILNAEQIKTAGVEYFKIHNFITEQGYYMTQYSNLVFQLRKGRHVLESADWNMKFLVTVK